MEMESVEERVDVEENTERKNKNWFDRWIDYVERSWDWDESTYGCYIFPYSCW